MIENYSRFWLLMARLPCDDKEEDSVNKNLDIYTTFNNLFNKEYQETDGYATKKFNFTVGFKATY